MKVVLEITFTFYFMNENNVIYINFYYLEYSRLYMVYKVSIIENVLIVCHVLQVK